MSCAICCLLIGAVFGAAANDWENPAVNSRNRLPDRTYSMPLADESAAFSDRVEPPTPWKLSLNGDWKISWAGNPSLRTKDFWKVDHDDSAWCEVDVPSCLETRGFGSPQYTNIEYPHSAKTPTIRNRSTGRDDYNPVASYRRRFSVPENWSGRRVILRFDGVYSAYYVWVNGRQVGYAEDSCLPSEFDITDCVRCGEAENVLAVEAYRWSDGSFLEDQDTFRFHGIFRDVTLWSMPKDGIWDFRVATSLAGDCKSARLELQGLSGDWSATLYDAGRRPVANLSSRSAASDIPTVFPWSAENPYLYTLVVRKGADVRAKRVGFKEQKIADGRFLVNGRPVKLHGVNRCETNPENGRTVSLADMTKDIEMFKRHNIDTVRTSHYPNHHLWYDLCDLYGIYVMSEANIETHGFNNNKATDPSYSPDWSAAFVERNARHVRIYRNHPSITMWSLGNEAAAGVWATNALAAIRALDPTRPTASNHAGGNALTDIEGGGYRSVEWLENRGKAGGRAHFFIEYGHAMGNALGNLQEYWNAFDKYGCLFGGCIWDWADQAVWKHTDRVDPKTGLRERYFGYGGDWDESPHSGNFCVNGIVDPLRNVTPKLIEVGHVHRPLVVTRAADGTLSLRNRWAFTCADRCTGTWELLEDGVVTKRGVFEVPALAPGGCCALPPPVDGWDKSKECFLNLTFALKDDTRWAKAGWTVARNQVRLTDGKLFAPGPGAADGVRVDGSDQKTVRVSAGTTRAVFSTETGTLCELEMAGVAILRDSAPGLAAGPRLSCARAFVDNDVWLKNGADGFLLSGLAELTYHSSPISVSGNVVRVTTAVDGARSAGFRHEQEWTFCADGSVRLRNVVEPHGTMPKQLPRLGLSLRLDKALENLAYYGRGPHENYVDRRTSAFFGVWKSTVSEQFVDYVRPQDNGSRNDLRWLELTDETGRGVRIAASMPLHVQALHYSTEDLDRVRHENGERRFRASLTPREDVFLTLDIRQCGLGGASCGPPPMDKYRFPVRREEWTVFLNAVPGVRTEDRGRHGPFGLTAEEVDALCPPRPETAATFKAGAYPPAARSYREAAKMAYRYMTSLPAMTALVETGKPNQKYQHNAYVSKTHAAHIKAMLDWAKIEPEERETAMRFAKASAELLLKELEPADAPLAFWPPTYGRKPLEFDPKTDGPYKKMAMIGNEPEGAVKYRGEVMLLYPADVGIAFADYWRETKDERFLRAALGIAETYLKTRREDGSWPLKMKLATGETVGENTLVPTYPLGLFEKLFDATNDPKWRTAADGCFAWLEKHPLADWNWDGQFEDIKPEKPYKNPTKHNAVETMLYILKRFPGDAARLATCRKILEFCEKRFVVWESPKNHPKWPAPSVLEQYSCFTPIDASAAKMIRAYVAMYKAEGRKEDLEKARALADSITRFQKPSGRIPTFWEGVNTDDSGLSHERYDWLNCMAAAAQALVQVAEVGRPPLVATAACACGGTMLWPSESGVLRAQPSSKLTVTNGMALVETGTDYAWPGVRLDFREKVRDFSGYGRLTVFVTNPSPQTVQVCLSVKSRALQGESPGGSVDLAPHAGGSISTNLRFYPWRLDAPLELFGIRGFPTTADGSMFDLRQVVSLHVFRGGASAPAQFAVTGIEADGGGSMTAAKVLSAASFKPFVDVYGQFLHDDWPGKIHSEDELRRSVSDEAKWLAENGESPISGTDAYGGWVAGPQLKATGYFRTEKVADKWWFVDPDGHLFFSHGIDCVNHDETATGVQGREDYFSGLPAKDDPTFGRFWRTVTWKAAYGFYAESNHWPYAAYDIGSANMFRRYGADWEKTAFSLAHRRIRAWGLNTIGNWSQPDICRMDLTPYVLWLDTAGTPRLDWANGWWGKLPDPWNPAFERTLRQRCRDAAKWMKTDRWCLGVFVDNELSWSEDPRMKEVAEKYFSTVRKVLREELPNHLYLGCRIAWGSDVVYRAAAKYCDVVSVNVYSRHPDRDLPADADDKPMLIGEFHFGALDRGMFHTGLVPTESQAERARCYRDFVNVCLDHPRMVGAHWFQWKDQPLTGRLWDGENYQIGFLTIADAPYPEIVEASREVAARMYERRFGRACVDHSASADGVRMTEGGFRNAFADGSGFHVGCNYWASHAGLYMWRRWNGEDVARDISELAKNGIDMMRVFPLWPDFQPLVRLVGGGGSDRGLCQGDGPLRNAAGVDEEMMRRFRFVCDEAEKHNVKLVVGLVTGWMSGRLFVPPAFESRNVITDADAQMWQVRFVRHFVRKMKDHPAIVAWDLGNECNCMASSDASQAWMWMNAMASAIRIEDRSRPVVSGMHSCSADRRAAWNLYDQGELMDVLTTHPYPLWTPDCNRERFDSLRDEAHAAVESLLYQGLSGKPCLVEEAGSMGPTVVSENRAAAAMRVALFNCWAEGLPGYLWWCAFDQNKLDFAPYDWTYIERELGLFKADRSPKPTAAVMHDFSDFLRAFPFERLPPKKVDAVCLLSDRADAWRPAFGAYLLSRQAGFGLIFASAEKPLPESRFYILPAMPGYCAYTGRAWRRLLEKVKDGATAFVSLGNDGGHTEFVEAIGLETLDHHKESISYRFSFANMPGESIVASDTHVRRNAVRTARVLAADEGGLPVVTVNSYGKGKIVYCNFPIETQGVVAGGCWTGKAINPLFRVYEIAAKEAGVSRVVEKDLPGVGISEHPLNDGRTVVIAINYEPEPSKCQIRVRGRVESSLRGRIQGNTLEIPANDAAVFVVRK